MSFIAGAGITNVDLLYQNPNITIAQLLDSDEFTYTKSSDVSDNADEDFAEFTL